MLDSYRLALLWLNNVGGHQQILDAFDQKELVPELSSEIWGGEVDLGMKRAFDYVLRDDAQVVSIRPLLFEVQCDFVEKIIEQLEDSIDANVRTRDYSLSATESDSFFNIAERVKFLFPGSLLCICDSYRVVQGEPPVRQRTAAIIWNGFAEQSWSQRFAVLRQISVHPFILIGVTCSDIKEGRFPGFSSRIAERRALWFDTATMNYSSLGR
ncbi:MAG TPA: hypothetical protein VM715_01020 [Candidatus Acidoferrum sp.]|nr:hypothetical protein [Candidatus Acidoferrum sp.]